MANEIVIVIGFIFTVAAMCKVWNLYAMKQYSESKGKKLGLTYGFYVDNLKFVEIEGTGNDENGDYDIAKAIKKIEMPDDVRIKA